jgi:hypothetical protein
VSSAHAAGWQHLLPTTLVRIDVALLSPCLYMTFLYSSAQAARFPLTCLASLVRIWGEA